MQKHEESKKLIFIFIYVLIYLLIYLFICLFIYLFIYLIVCFCMIMVLFRVLFDFISFWILSFAPCKVFQRSYNFKVVNRLCERLFSFFSSR